MMRYVAMKQQIRSNPDSSRSKVKVVAGPFQELTSLPKERESLRFKTIPMRIKDLVEHEDLEKDKEPDSLKNTPTKTNEFGKQTLVKAEDLFEDQMACKLPKIDPFDKEVLPFIKHPRKFKCKKKLFH